ncbi:hypothetical protein BaRGS_00013454, partial [Batillaria attramentaria]
RCESGWRLAKIICPMICGELSVPDLRGVIFPPDLATCILLDKGAVAVRDVVQWMVEKNNRNNSDSRIVIDSKLHIVDMDDSFRLSTTMCEQLNKGVFLLLGGSSPKSFNVIQSYTHALHVPYVMYTNNRNHHHDGYDYDFSVSPAFIDAIIDVVKFFNWEKVYYLFDSDDGLWQLQQIYESFRDPLLPLLVDARRVRNTASAHDFLRRLDRVSKSEKKRIILNFSSLDVYQKILNQDIDKLDLHSFIHGGVNVTGFRLPLTPLTTTFQRVRSHSGPRYNSSTLSTDAALALDGLQTIITALNTLLLNDETRRIFKTSFRHGEMYNNNSRGIQCWTQPVKPWVHGHTIKNALAQVGLVLVEVIVVVVEMVVVVEVVVVVVDVVVVVVEAVERIVHFFRGLFTIFLFIVQVGTWSADKGMQSNLTGAKTENPFLMLKCPNDGSPCTGNQRFEGYCVDLIERIAENVGFQYTLKLVKDGNYGSPQADGKTWNGMIGELIRKEADIALAALSISEVRERVVDFSKPYMDTGTSIMIKKPDKQQGGVFSFKSPLSDEVWISIAFGFLAVSFVLFLVGRFSPYEWPEPNEQKEEEGGAGTNVSPNPFTLANTLWFSLGALMQQGSDISPSSISGRVVGAAWWFFTLIIISSYTANLAAFLTIERMDMPINSPDDLVKQREIRYGTVENGSTQTFFKESEVTVYKQMWNFMKEAEPSVFTPSVEEGVKRVRQCKGKYAFLLDAAMNEYHNQRKPCNTLKAGRNLDDKGYGIATPLNSDLREQINIAVLELREVGELHKLERKWWYDKGECGCNVKESKTSSLTLSNVSGIFHILIGGLVLSMVVAFLDYCIRWKLRTRKFKPNFVTARVQQLRDRARRQRREIHYEPQAASASPGPGKNGAVG